jgi:hypothetical protein
MILNFAKVSVFSIKLRDEHRRCRTLTAIQKFPIAGINVRHTIDELRSEYMIVPRASDLTGISCDDSDRLLIDSAQQHNIDIHN